jgi:hypothetical protein
MYGQWQPGPKRMNANTGRFGMGFPQGFSFSMALCRRGDEMYVVPGFHLDCEMAWMDR